MSTILIIAAIIPLALAAWFGYFAARFAITNRITTVRQLVLSVIGFLVVFSLAMWFLSVHLPTTIVRNEARVAANWGPIIDRLIIQPGTTLTGADGLDLGLSGGTEITPVDTNPLVDALSEEAHAQAAEAPAPAPPPPGSQVYVVQPGDTFNEIAAAHNVTPEDLAAANPQIVEPGNLAVGQPLNIPGGVPAPAETEAQATDPPVDDSQRVVEVPAETVPVETATPDPMAQEVTDAQERAARLKTLYDQLTQAAGASDREAGRAIVSEILAINPEDRAAVNARQAIQEAEEKISRFDQAAALAGGSAYCSSTEGQSSARFLLQGATWHVENSGAKTFGKLYDEVASIKVIQGDWIVGKQIRIRRCYLAAFSATETGDTFTIR